MYCVLVCGWGLDLSKLQTTNIPVFDVIKFNLHGWTRHSNMLKFFLIFLNHEKFSWLGGTVLSRVSTTWQLRPVPLVKYSKPHLCWKRHGLGKCQTKLLKQTNIANNGTIFEAKIKLWGGKTRTWLIKNNYSF